MGRRRVWIAVLVVFVVGLFVFVATIWPDVSRTIQTMRDFARQASLYSRPFEPYVQSLVDAGDVVDFEKLDGPMPPDAQNAAGEIDAACQWVRETVGAEDAWPARPLRDAENVAAWDAAAKATPSLRIEMEEFVERMRPFFDRVSSALDRPTLRYPRTEDSSTGLLVVAGVSRVQNTVRLLVLRGRAARRPEDRIAAARDGMRIGRRLAANDAITHMVAIASYVAGLTTLRHDVEDGSVDPSTARAALGDLLAAEWWSRMDDVLRQERAHTIWSFRAMRDGRLKPSAEDKQNWPSQADMRNPAAASPFIAACDVCTKATKWSPLPYATWRRRFDALLDETGARSNAFVGIVPASVAGRLCRADAQTRLARVALAVAEHRATRADFPASLDDLKPLFPDGVPLDPCTDAPFVYEKTVTGVRIASPGRLPEDPPLDDATLRERCLVWELKR